MSVTPLYIRIRAVDREPIRVWNGTKNQKVPYGSSIIVNMNDPFTRRDLHHYIGRWVAADDQYAKLALTDVDTAGGLAAWANPEGVPIFVTNVYLDVTSVATAACTVSAGVAANATTLNSGMLSGKDVHTAVATFSSAGAIQKMSASQFVTFSTATGASAGMVATGYITYMLA